MLYGSFNYNHVILVQTLLWIFSLLSRDRFTKQPHRLNELLFSWFSPIHGKADSIKIAIASVV